MNTSDQGTTTLDEARDELRRAGYVVLRDIGTSEEDLAALVRSVSRPRGGTFWPATQTVLYTPGTDPTDSVALSSARLSPHTDGSFEDDPPSALFLQCITPDIPGHGESRVVPVVSILDGLPADTTALLFEPIFLFVKEVDGVAARVEGPVLTRELDGSTTIRYRHDEKYRIRARTPQGDDAVAALADFVMRSDNQEPVALDTGDVLWLDNHRALHARTALSGQRMRHLRTAWGDTD